MIEQELQNLKELRMTKNNIVAVRHLSTCNKWRALDPKIAWATKHYYFTNNTNIDLEVGQFLRGTSNHLVLVVYVGPECDFKPEKDITTHHVCRNFPIRIQDTYKGAKDES